jgi:ankyrin repeat protein
MRAQRRPQEGMKNMAKFKNPNSLSDTALAVELQNASKLEAPATLASWSERVKEEIGRALAEDDGVGLAAALDLVAQERGAGDRTGIERLGLGVDNGAEVAKTLLVEAARQGRPRCLAALLLAFDAKGSGQWALAGAMEVCLACAADEGGAESLRALIEADANVQSRVDWQTPLMRAARAGSAECVELLLPHSHVEARDQGKRSALMLAAFDGRADCVALIAKAASKDSVSAEGWSALCFAAVGGDEDPLTGQLPAGGNERCVEALLAAGHNPAHRTKNGETPLIIAARSGRLGAARALLPVSDPEAQDDRGRTPLERAARTGEAALVRLIASRADPRRKDKEGQDALMVAAKEGQSEVVEALLGRCDPLAADLHGRTALMAAVWIGDEKSMRLLVPVSDLLAKDLHGESAEDIALAVGFAPLAEHLARERKIRERARREKEELEASVRTASRAATAGANEGEGENDPDADANRAAGAGASVKDGEKNNRAQKTAPNRGPRSL